MYVQMNPVYGHNYKAGQIFFTFTIDSPISNGVTWFTCKDVSKIDELKKVSHCGIVIGEGLGIAALAEADSFTYQDLNEIFNNPKTRIFFREPKKLDELGSDIIVSTSKGYEGTKYNYRLATGFAVTNLWLMRKLLSEERRKSLLAKFNEMDKMICSQACMMMTFSAGFHIDMDFIRSPYEVLMHDMFKEWK